MTQERQVKSDERDAEKLFYSVILSAAKNLLLYNEILISVLC